MIVGSVSSLSFLIHVTKTRLYKKLKSRKHTNLTSFLRKEKKKKEGRRQKIINFFVGLLVFLSIKKVKSGTDV